MNDRIPPSLPPDPRFPRALDELLAALPTDVAPPARLWHDIVFGIARRHHRTRQLALAASLACAVLAAGLIWAVMRGTPESRARLPLVAAHATPVRAPGTTAGVGPGQTPREPATFGEPADAKYLATRASLETTFRERLASLDPTTRAQIEASLAVIRQAHEDIRQALAAAPADPVLQQLFESTWHEEFDLYDHVVRATQPTVART